MLMRCFYIRVHGFKGTMALPAGGHTDTHYILAASREQHPLDAHTHTGTVNMETICAAVLCNTMQMGLQLVVLHLYMNS